MECDVCGDEMEDEKKVLVQGMEIKITSLDKEPHPEYQKLIDTFGKSEFHVCFVCWIKALGVKPIN